MKKELGILFLFGVLLVSPLILAQEQAQVYSGFDRFVDDVKLFFSFGDNKVILASEVREKEVYSAIENFNNENNEGMSKNLENAWDKLQTIQEKVSLNVAEEVRESSVQIRERIAQEENLPNDFEVYALEEEKTELTAEWVVEVGGKEGQTLEREIVGEDNGERIVEIETRIGEIDNEISNWVVENEVVEGDNGLTRVVKTEIANGDNGLKPEVKTYMDVVKGNNVDKPSMTKDNEDVAPSNQVDNSVDDIIGGDSGDGVAPGPQGIVGYQNTESQDDNSVSPDSTDNSDEGSSDSGNSWK